MTGRKDSKDEDFSLVPPDPLTSLLYELMTNEDEQSNWILDAAWAFSSWVSGELDRSALIYAAKCVCIGLGERQVLDALARVYRVGSQKYGDMNWRNGYKWSLSVAAGYRHLLAHMFSELMDEENREIHLASFVWHCFTLHEFERLHIGEDDVRPRWRVA